MVLVKTKKWGNSIGIIIPKEIARELKLSQGEQIDVDFHKKSRLVLKDLWEFGKQHGKIDLRLLKEIRKGESKYPI